LSDAAHADREDVDGQNKVPPEDVGV
jgi:hypothetical protein